MDGQNYSDSDKNQAETSKANAPSEEPKQPQAFFGYDLFEDNNYLNANELQMLEWDP